MKNLMRVLAIVLSVSATLQAIVAYAQESTPISIEVEEYKIARLIELKYKMNATRNSDSTSVDAATAAMNAEFPNITTEAEYAEEFLTHVLRYMKGLGAEAIFRRMIRLPEFSKFGSEPSV